ncbi:MAG: ATP-binding protein [Methylococcales bacterium]|nr:ATP-binding protein [Methylococcales bacterium]
MRTQSLSFRLLMSAILVMVFFFALVAIVLGRSFLESAEQALKETLQVQVYALLSDAELPRAGGLLSMPPSQHEPRFANPGSGLYAFITYNSKQIIWRSPSAIAQEFTVPASILPGKAVFEKDSAHNRYNLHYKVIWETNRKSTREYVFSVTEDAHFVTQQVNRFRKTLVLWLGIVGFLLILIQLVVLRWSLKPLRTIVSDLEKIEAGFKQQLDGVYPAELHGLAGNLNILINSERAHLERYRNTLADLAHSLKTPLAILRGCVATAGSNRPIMEDQISRMNEIVEYQLQRAAIKGGKKISAKVDLVEITHKIIASLNKVYSDKNIQFELDLPEQCWVYCEEGDVYEIVGNLLDNACKWCNRRIAVSLNNAHRAVGSSLILHIEDDGPGILADKLNAILGRGVRADENIHGHGIGMAVVYELINLLGGQLQGLKSPRLGGMYWKVHLP